MAGTTLQTTTHAVKHAEWTEKSPKKPANDDYVIAAPDLRLFIVCDGVSGHAGGNVASKLTAETVLQEIRQKLAGAEFPSLKEAAVLVRDAVYLANKVVYERAHLDASLAKMATTFDLVWLIGDHLLSAHTGDGRVFLARHGTVMRVTKDHSYVQELIDSGAMNEEQAKRSPYAHTLTHAVGIHQTTRVDLLGPEIQAGDTILICTDGVYGGCSDAQIMNLLSKASGNLEPTLQALVKSSRAGGCQDDATGVLLEIGGHLSGAPISAPRPLPQAKVQALDLSPCFGELSFSDKTRLLEIARQRRLAPGEVLAREGEVANHLWVLVSGKVRITEKGVPLAERAGPATLGEAALMEQEPRSATVSAIDEVHVLEFDRSRVLAFFEPHMRNPAAQMYRAIAKIEHERMRDLSKKLAAASTVRS